MESPPPIKRWVITAYLRRYGLRHFVETGTHLGDTLAMVAKDSRIRCTSIELAESYFQEAVGRFSAYPNVRLLQGNSGMLLPQVVAELRYPALFWLDGHYSGGVTAQGELETPISAELRAILDAPVCGHVVLIDDVRCFDGTHDYPHLDELLRDVRHDGRYAIEVSADIARLIPRVCPESLTCDLPRNSVFQESRQDNETGGKRCSRYRTGILPMPRV